MTDAQKQKYQRRAIGFLKSRAIAQPWNTQSQYRWRAAGTQLMARPLLFLFSFA